MPKYVIERKIPGVGKRTPEELKSISQVSCGVLNDLGPKDPVGPESRHVLCLHRPERGVDSRACATRRVSGGPDLRSAVGDRPDHRGGRWRAPGRLTATLNASLGGRRATPNVALRRSG